MSREEIFALCFAEAPIACHEIDAAGAVALVNAAECAMLGLPASKIIGQAVWNLMAPDQRELSRAAIQQKLAGEQSLPVYFRTFLRADGARVVLEMRDMYLRTETGAVSGIRTFLLDVTQRQAAERALRASEERYRHLVEHASDIIYQADLNGQFIVFNRMATELLGYSAEELIGRKYLDLIRPDFRARTQRFYRHQLARRIERTYFEFPVLSRDGREIWFGQNVELILEDGQPTSFEAVTRDITRQRHAAEEQRQAREELERRVRERTAELEQANAALLEEIQRRHELEAQRLAVEAQMQYTQRLESLGVLAGGIAHDFNNLLAAIMGHADLASLDLPPGSPVLPHLEQVLEASRTAAELTQQMLAYSGKGRFVMESVDISALTEDALRLIRSMISKKATLRMELTRDLCAVRSDPAQIRQVITNLLTNASEALLEEAGEIRVSTRELIASDGMLPSLHPGKLLPGGRYAVIEVTDTGSGMDAATQAKIFDPFFTTKFHGRGLGLAAVLGIVRSHEGSIEVESAPGKGSTFRVFLPCVEVPAPSPLVEHRELKPDWRFDGTVLVVDDEPSVRNLAKAILERVGAVVLTADDSDEGLARFTEHSGAIRAVLLDLTMPGIDIATVFGRLIEDRPDLKVIVCSGYTWQDVEAALKGGRPAAFLRKPFGAAELIAAFQSVFTP